MSSLGLCSTLACGGSADSNPDPSGSASESASTSTSTSESGEPTESGESTTTGGDVYDCANLPTPQIHQLDGPIAAADVAFDDQGNLVGSNTQDLFKASSAIGQPSLWVPGVEGRAAVRQLSDGRIAVVQENFFRVLLFTPDGSAQTLASNLVYPFGLVEDLEGNIYIGDETRIMRVDPDVGEAEVWLDGEPFVSRWMSFDRDYDGIFVGGRSKTIYRVPITASGQAGAPVEWGTLPTPMPMDPGPGPGSDPESDVTPGETEGGDIGSGETGDGGGEGPTLVDGVGVDACGNVYVAEFHSRGLYKIPAGGGEGELLVDWGPVDYGHGLQWGSGMGEWSETSLFLPQPYNDYNVVEVDIGVPGKDLP